MVKFLDWSSEMPGKEEPNMIHVFGRPNWWFLVKMVLSLANKATNGIYKKEHVAVHTWLIGGYMWSKCLNLCIYRYDICIAVTV